MGRKPTRGEKPERVSFEIHEENARKLELLTKNKNIKLTTVINNLLCFFLEMPEDLTVSFNSFISTSITSLDETNQNSQDFNRNILTKEIEGLKLMYTLINKGANYETEHTLRISNGILLIPHEWIIVNPEVAAESSCAIVLECRNGNKLKLPHFVYLTNDPNVINDQAELTEFKELCSAKWPQFKEKILDRQITPKYDDDYYITNLHEWQLSPAIGFFDIDAIPIESIEERNKKPYRAAIILNERK